MRTGRILRFATYLAPAMRGLYELAADVVARAIRHDVELVDASAYGQLAARAYDAAFVCGLPYVLLTAGGAPYRPLVATVHRGARYEGRPIYWSDVIVAAGAPCRSFADLRGRSWAYNERWSHSGHGVTRAHLARLGLDWSFFREVRCAGFHERAIRMVVDGRVDAAAIDSVVLDAVTAADVALASRIRIIEALGPSTVQPLVAATDLPDDLVAVMRAALLEMPATPSAGAVMHRCRTLRFVPVGDGAYDDIRAMLRDAEHAGVPALG